MYIIELNLFCVIYLPLILSNTSWGMYSIPKDLEYTAIFLSINNETQCIPLICLSLTFMFFPLFYVNRMNSIKPEFVFKMLSKMLKGWSRTKIFCPFDPYHYILFMLLKHSFLPSRLLFQLAYFLTLMLPNFPITH